MATDSDCLTTCGDGICVGNAGELCVNCAECNTQATDVCGNGQCDPGEDSDVCYADCGPTPWAWTAEEADFIARLNTARTGGTMCPGGGGTQTAAALTVIPSLEAGAHEYSWELAYQQFQSGGACNGRDGIGRVQTAGGSNGYALWIGAGFATPQDALTYFLGDNAMCVSFMNQNYRRAGIGITYLDTQRWYVVFLD